MRMHQLKLAPVSVSVTGIEANQYFAIDVQGFAMIYKCRTHAHGVLFDDREEPMPFKAEECYTVLNDPSITIQKLQYQCTMDRNKALGLKNNNKNYEEVKSEELVAKYSKKKKN